MTTRMYAEMILRSWWLILIVVAVSVAAAYLASDSMAPVYQTQARYVVAPSSRLTEASEVVNTLYALDRRSIVFTYAEVFNSDRIFDAAATAVELNDKDSAAYDASAVVLPETNVLELAVEGADPTTTARFANELGQQAVDYIRELYPIYSVILLDAATIPDAPVRPRPARDAVFAASLGLVFGVALAILRGHLWPARSSHPTAHPTNHSVMPRDWESFETQVKYDVDMSTIDSQHSLAFITISGLEYLDEADVSEARRWIRESLLEQTWAEVRSPDRVTWIDNVLVIFFPNLAVDASAAIMERLRKSLKLPILSPAAQSVSLQIGVVAYEAEVPLSDIADWSLSSLESTRRNKHVQIFDRADFIPPATKLAR